MSNNSDMNRIMVLNSFVQFVVSFSLVCPNKFSTDMVFKVKWLQQLFLYFECQRNILFKPQC